MVPHFEKMLYDNALLCRVYAHLWRATGSEQARRVALETADFLVREMRTEQGGFASALDADSDDGTGRHAEGAMTLFPPTWVTLHGLRGAPSVDDALRALRAAEVETFVGRFSEDRTLLYWQEDEHFAASDADALDRAADAPGPRHRLIMERRPWVYVRSH